MWITSWKRTSLMNSVILGMDWAEYNMTRIRCIAVFKSGPDLVASDATLLLLQGIHNTLCV